MNRWSSFPELRTERLLLRAFTQEDMPQVFLGLSHPEVIKYYGISYKTLQGTQVQMDWYRDIYERGTGLWWAITLQQSPAEILGACGFNNWNQVHNNAETGYWLMPAAQRQGIMTEAFAAAIDFAFTGMGLHRIVATVERENSNSIWLLEKMHFVQEGTQREVEFKNDKYIDLLQYSLINSKD